MRKILFWSFLFVFFTSYTQERLYYKEKLFSEADTSKFYTVAGERHGISFFKKEKFKEVEYTPGNKLTFDIYHTPEVMYHWYRK